MGHNQPQLNQANTQLEITMSDEKVLTKEIAEQFIADEDSVDLSEFTAIEDDAAEIIGKLRVHPFFAGSNEEYGSNRYTAVQPF